MPQQKNNRFLNVIDEFSCLDFTGICESQYSELGFVQSRNKKSLRIVMSYLFGEIEFLFNEVEIEERIGVAKSKDIENLTMRDIQTTKIFSFYEPFKDL